MSASEVRIDDRETGPFTNPWPALLAGVAACLMAYGFQVVAPGLGWSRLVLVAVGVLATGAAVAIRPASWQVLLGAAFASFLAGQAAFAKSLADQTATEWDSAQLMFRILAVVAGLSAAVVWFPSPVRRVVVSVLLFLHFGGILTAVASPSMGWLAGQLWTYVYRPYLQCMYLNNAYHFYSPEPGPAPLLWFCIEYEPDADGSRNLRWVKVPNLDKDGRHLRADGSPLWPNLEYTRRISIAESTNFPGSTLPVNLEVFGQHRKAAWERTGIPGQVTETDRPQPPWYLEPADVTNVWLRSYARHVATHYKHQSKPDREVIGVKVYRVIHSIISPAELQKGKEPDDPTLYLPYYMGEFDKDGKPKPAHYAMQLVDPVTRSEVVVDRDPFLYTLIPITRPPVDPNQTFRYQGQPPKVKNYVLIHAGDVDEGDLP
jgi:hypothetical protein